jgi:hypothetical protein
LRIKIRSAAYSDKCNVLLCEGRKYVNYFFPVPTNRPADSEGGSQCFWEVYQRKMKGNFNANVLRGEAGTWDEQKELLISYVQMAESYLRTMSYFYDDKCVAWREAKKEASARLKSIKENLEEVTEVEILQDKRSLLLHSNIWPCMHTEPICIFDHIDKWYYVLGPPEPKKENFSFAIQPPKLIELHSRFQPCSNYNCGNMLTRVAEVIGRNISFFYYK